MRVQGVQTLLQVIFWLTLVSTVGWCVMWSVHQGTLTDPAPEETEKDRSEARVMVPLYLKLAALSGFVCLFALLAWKFA